MPAGGGIHLLMALAVATVLLCCTSILVPSILHADVVYCRLSFMLPANQVDSAFHPFEVDKLSSKL